MPCILDRTCIILGCASCHAYVVVVYYVVCFFPVLLLRVSSDNVVSVRICSTSSVCLLHALVLLPCGISGKMTIPSKSLLSLLARCSLFCYAYAAIPTTCYIMPPILPCQPLTTHVLANRCLAMLPLCSALLIALLVEGEVEVCSFLEHGDVVPCWNLIYFGISQYIWFYLMHLYTW